MEHQRSVIVVFVVAGVLAGVFAHQISDAVLRAIAAEVPTVLGLLTGPVIVGVVVGAGVFFALLRHERARVFVDSVVAELHQVTWPTRAETTQNTGIVVGATVLFAALLAVYDLAWGRVTGLFLFG